MSTATPTDLRDVRPPAVAGLFYPADPASLAATVDRLLTVDPPAAPGPKALVVPHAGYPYSGPVAASAFAQLRPRRGEIRRVVLLGPSHRVPLRGLAASSVAAFDTPLGPVPLDRAAIDDLVRLEQVHTLDAAHAVEHSLEVQLPFLQRLLPEFRLVPLAAGDAEAAAVAEVLERVWGGPETIVLVSSDLSHYHDYATARALDEATTRAIEALAPERIDFEHACGRVPLNGLLTLARRRGLTARALDLRSSGDTAGPRDRVVGYGAYAVG